MKNLLLVLAIFGIAIGCKKDNDEDEIIPISKLYDYSRFWRCTHMKSNLFGASNASDKEINSKLNDYKPDLSLSLTQAGYWTFMVENFLVGTYEYKFREDKYITLNIDDNTKLRATGYIKGGKLYLSFSYLDFDILIDLLGDNFPYNKGMLANINGGEVTLVFSDK